MNGDGQVVRSRCGVVRWRGLFSGGGGARFGRLAMVGSGCIHTSRRKQKEGVIADVGGGDGHSWCNVVTCFEIERTRSLHHPGDFHKPDQPISRQVPPPRLHVSVQSSALCTQPRFTRYTFEPLCFSVCEPGCGRDKLQITLHSAPSRLCHKTSSSFMRETHNTPALVTFLPIREMLVLLNKNIDLPLFDISFLPEAALFPKQPASRCMTSGLIICSSRDTSQAVAAAVVLRLTVEDSM
jgi:hypothetical protein